MPLDTRQLKCMPLGLDPQAYVEDKAAASPHPVIPLPEFGKVYAAELQARCFQPPFQSLLCSHDKDSSEKQFSQSDMRSWCAATPNGALESPQKRLLIFDQSGNQTRLLRCPFPLQFPSPAAAEPRKLPSLHDLEKDFGEDGVIPDKIPVHEMFDENQMNEKESEMHEDTEEINALLYSDDDYDDDNDGDDDCESDDEVMSTGHSPFPVCTKRELEELEMDDSPCKRQKLLDIKSSTKLKGSFPVSNISTKQDTGSGLSNGQSRKDKIHTVLKILESVVPGSKGKDSLLLLDEAIDYLKLLKRNLISPEINHNY